MAKLDREALEARSVRLRELIDENPDDKTLWFGLGQALLRLSEPGDAVDAFRNATQLDANYTAAFRDLGRALLESGDPCEAARVFAHAIALAEKTGDLQTGREIHVFLRRAEQASATRKGL
ncbi:MAG: tetratricopeptide repeat protein [Myxococcota bacterium]|jgi:cytochrome c-type biogenesis protein CcmH/NrfG|nr:hypothetical protein [Deltaproteobacteria bacterium]MCP4245274.1 tetratricopeptide repeat protein [bacterium]MDP6073964.1 tetratricopeptide repeat protein [Myxococcota bacterium]MBT39950.1 hypothetical protein [Deltaproteobacteria bacterium]MDP6241851.1 tetratricopeptide repeat protein [Myxococcota bacterium]